ncbi:MAG: hypothetical protein OJF62_002449 [Pseudolabrys sp.]|nr:hypothetical protein [Pseudolabrys sp.]
MPCIIPELIMPRFVRCSGMSEFVAPVVLSPCIIPGAMPPGMP